jgi:hypothetical protein
MKTVQQPTPTRPDVDIDLIEDVCPDVAARSAIVEKLAWTWSQFEPGGINIALDHDCWRGIEDLMIANRKDLARLYAMANGEQEEGGAR